MSAGRHDAVSAMLGEYAFGHLSAEERREVEAHLGECATCASELREYALLMGAMARTPEPVSPPDALRQRVLDGLPSRAVAPAADRVGDWKRWPLAAAAAVLLGAGATMWVARDARRAEADLRATIGELEQRLAQFSGQTDLALSILTAADMRPIALGGRENATASAARAYWSPTRGLLVVADRLPAPPPGRIYQVWIIGGGATVSAGLLGSQGAERGMLIVPPPAGLTPGVVTVAVTDEPPGGLAAPTGAMRLVGS